MDAAISSCLNQTYQNLEIIIIDDCSTDNSYEIAKRFQEHDGRIKLITNSENIKLPANLNLGHKVAKGEYLTWTSHDNNFHPDAIEALYKALVKKKVDVVYTSYLIIDENGTLKDAVRLKEIEYSFFYGVVGACFLYTKRFYVQNGEYDENLFLLEDFDFWLRGLKHGNFFKIDNPGFYFYRNHDEALTSKINNEKLLKIEFQKKRIKCYKKLFEIEDSIISDSEFLKYFDGYWSGDLNRRMIPLYSKTFFKELKKKLVTFKGITYIKLKRIIVEDCIEVILKNREHQKISLLLNLHFFAGDELLRLPVKRYLALLKKCFL